MKCWDFDPNKRSTAAIIKKKLINICDFEYINNNLTEIIKSPDIGPIVTNNTGEIYSSRLLSGVIKSAMTIRGLRSQSITLGNTVY